MRSLHVRIPLVIALSSLAAPEARAQAELHEIKGAQPLSHFGSSLAGVGDTNADGELDYAAGAHDDGTAAASKAGSVRVFRADDGFMNWARFGAGEGALLGASVAATGDVDGDGHADVVAGAPGEVSGGLTLGSATVFAGQNGAILHKVFGVTPLSNFGWSVSGGGDVDGDGVVDFAVGASRDNHNGAESGSVYVYSGASGALIRRHDGAQAGVRLGTRVVIPGDVNHDGRADVAAAHALFFAPEHSAVHVFSGLDGSLLHVFTGAVAGYGLSSAGDLDGDGAVDIAVGEPAFHGTWVLQGRVRVYSGSTGAVLLEKRGSKMHQHFGWSVGSAGDANGDSVPDLLVGTLYGDVSFVSSGYVTVLSGVDGAVLSQVEAGPSQDYFAHSVAGVGDVNGDGLDDFAASAPEFTEGTPGYGFARVFLSGCPEPVRYCFAAANSTGGGAQLSHLGGPSISANNMALVVDHAPPGKLALFRYGSASAQAPLGDGFLCIGGTTFRLGSPQMIESNGQIFRAIDFSNPPAGSGPAQILPGSTWHFQMQYRDPAGPLGSGFNSTDALKATFVL